MYIRELKIAGKVFAHNLALAPLAGITNPAFRRICREFGADLTFTEMVSVDGIVHGNEATRQLLDGYENEENLGIQIFGSDPEVFERAMPVLLDYYPAVIDLNFGCPVPKVVKRGAGAALLKNLDRMRKIISTVAQFEIPLSVKLRIGWDRENIVAVEAARIAENSGAHAVTIHGRTRSQGYSGQADWSHIAEVKAALKIPVIGNGDVFSAADAQRMFRETGVDGIMLARGTMGRPWLFREILDELRDKKNFLEPDIESRIQVLKRHYRMEEKLFGEKAALQKMKKHFVWYTRGLPHVVKLRDKIFRGDDFRGVLQLFDDYIKFMQDRESGEKE